MRDRADIINRIKSCLKLAERPGTEDEGRQAKAMADRMIAKYGITPDELIDDPWAGIKVTYGEPTWKRAERTWTASKTTVFSPNNYYMPGKRDLLNAIARNNGIRIIVIDGGTKEQYVQILEGDQDILLAGYNAALKRAERLMPKDIKRVKSAHTAFLQGYAAALRGESRVPWRCKNSAAWLAGNAAGLI